jgi:hypothetical protein
MTLTASSAETYSRSRWRLHELLEPEQQAPRRVTVSAPALLVRLGRLVVDTIRISPHECTQAAQG